MRLPIAVAALLASTARAAALATGYKPAEIDARFDNRPLEVAGRFAAVAAAALRIRLADDDGLTLRTELGKLGPVFCKVGQTLATRPDIIGIEVSRSLGKLQDAMEP